MSCEGSQQSDHLLLLYCCCCPLCRWHLHAQGSRWHEQGLCIHRVQEPTGQSECPAGLAAAAALVLCSSVLQQATPVCSSRPGGCSQQQGTQQQIAGSRQSKVWAVLLTAASKLCGSSFDSFCIDLYMLCQCMWLGEGATECLGVVEGLPVAAARAVQQWWG
jgi:hypothetical protein